MPAFCVQFHLTLESLVNSFQEKWKAGGRGACGRACCARLLCPPAGSAFTCCSTFLMWTAWGWGSPFCPYVIHPLRLMMVTLIRRKKIISSASGHFLLSSAKFSYKCRLLMQYLPSTMLLYVTAQHALGNHFLPKEPLPFPCRHFVSFPEYTRPRENYN